MALQASTEPVKIVQLTPDHMIAVGTSWGKHSWKPARELRTGMHLLSKVVTHMPSAYVGFVRQDVKYMQAPKQFTPKLVQLHKEAREHVPCAVLALA